MYNAIKRAVQPINVSCLGLLTGKSANGTPITVRTLATVNLFFLLHKPKGSNLCLLVFPRICSWRGTSGCSININQRTQATHDSKVDIPASMSTAFHDFPYPPASTVSSILLPIWHTAPRPQRLRQDQRQRQMLAINEELRIRALS